MERETPHGSKIYSNKALGIDEGEYPRNSHFYPEGKERPIERKGKRGVEVGYRDPMTVGKEQQFTYQDSIVVFDGDNATTMVDKRTVVYTKENK